MTKKYSIIIILIIFVLTNIPELQAEIDIVPEVSIGISENFDDHLGAYDPDDRFFSSLFGDFYFDFVFSKSFRTSIRYGLERSTHWSEPLNVSDSFNHTVENDINIKLSSAFSVRVRNQFLSYYDITPEYRSWQYTPGLQMKYKLGSDNYLLAQGRYRIRQFPGLKDPEGRKINDSSSVMIDIGMRNRPFQKTLTYLNYQYERKVYDYTAVGYEGGEYVYAIGQSYKNLKKYNTHIVSLNILQYILSRLYANFDYLLIYRATENAPAIVLKAFTFNNNPLYFPVPVENYYDYLSNELSVKFNYTLTDEISLQPLFLMEYLNYRTRQALSANSEERGLEYDVRADIGLTMTWDISSLISFYEGMNSQLYLGYKWTKKYSNNKYESTGIKYFNYISNLYYLGLTFSFI